MPVPTPSQTLALTIPDGKYTVAEDAHRRLLTYIHAPELFALKRGEAAHSIFAHLATHIGMGWTFNEFLAAVQATPGDGVVFGGGTFTYNQQILIGHSYVIKSVMHSVERKHGRRAGTFDAITVALDLIDVEGTGEPAVSTTETYIVPRRTLDSRPATTAAAPIEPVESVSTGAYPVGPIALDDIVGIMDVMGDTNPVHIDLDLALASGYRGIVHQGPANLGFIFNAMAADRGTVTDIRHAAFTFRDTVTEGDRLEVRLTRPQVEPEDRETLDGALVILGGDVALTCRAQFGS